jgi:hypothetical protein
MYFADQWWNSVPELIRKTDEFYAKNVVKNPNADKLSVTTQKIVDSRNWKPALPFIQKNFSSVLSDLNIFYVPKTYEPGPLFVFPIQDLDGNYMRAQTRPCEGSVLFGQGKYHWIGEKLFEPNWLGNDVATLRRILEQRMVILVEGPFDLLACRLVAPDMPIMSPLSKSLSDKHEAYLRILGVETLILMFDNERPNKEQYDIGGGNLSMRILKNKIKSMQVFIQLLEGGNDPASALQSTQGAKRLRELLKGDDL